MSRKRHSHPHHRRRKRAPREELYSFLRQSGISARNIEQIQKLAQHADAGIRELAEVVLAIARVKPGRRRRMQLIAREHPDLFIDMVAVLDEEFWDDFFYRYGDQPEWLSERWEQARFQVRIHERETPLCWCGSGHAYWHCCAERDDRFAEQFAAEERARAWMQNSEPFPWWHPDSGIDHWTRSAYEMHYIDSNHPFALTPPECAEAAHARSAVLKRGRAQD